ncbi:MAG TPA: hypothetical protein QF353_01475 [Gammaproteobacteria bacterium]|nr:hypothetical protein [Gammaproteobacteria bacterium]
MKILRFPYPLGPDDDGIAWANALLAQPKYKVVLTWVRFKDFTENYHYSWSRQDAELHQQLFEHLLEYFNLQQESLNHVEGRSAAISVQLGYSPRLLTEIQSDLDIKEALIRKGMFDANDNYAVPTVLLANVLGFPFIVDKYLKSSRMDSLYYDQGQTLVSVFFEPNYVSNATNLESLFENNSVTNPLYEPQKNLDEASKIKGYNKKLNRLIQWVVGKRINLNQELSNYRFRSASLLHMVIAEPSFDLKTIPEDANSTLKTLLDNHNDLMIRLFNYLLEHTDIMVTSRDHDNYYSQKTTGVFERNRHLADVNILVEATRSNKACFLNKIKARLLRLNIEDLSRFLNQKMQHRVFQEVSKGFYKTEEDYVQHTNLVPYPTQLIPEEPDQRFVDLGYMQQDDTQVYFNLPVTEYGNYSVSDYFLRQQDTKNLTWVLRRGASSMDVLQFQQENELHHDRCDFSVDDLRLCELANHMQTNNVFPLLYSPNNMGIIVRQGDLENFFINPINEVESQYLLHDNIVPLYSFKDASSGRVKIDGIPAIQVIQAEIDANNLIIPKIENVLRRFFKQNKSNKYQSYRSKSVSANLRKHCDENGGKIGDDLKEELRTLNQQTVYQVGSTDILCENRPSIGHAGNCLVRGFNGDGTYTDIITTLTKIINNDSNKEKAIAGYFLALARGCSYEQACEAHLQAIATDDHDVLNHTYYLVVIREVSRRYNTGLTPYGNTPQKYPFCLAQYCAITLVADGFLTFKQFLNQDAAYGLPTGAGVCTWQSIARSTQKVVDILKIFVSTKVPDNWMDVFKALNNNQFFISLSSRDLKGIFENELKFTSPNPVASTQISSVPMPVPNIPTITPIPICRDITVKV